MGRSTYKNIFRRWEEVSSLPDQNIGPLTGLFHKLAYVVKRRQFTTYFLISIAVVTLLYAIFGSAIVRLTTILQRGF